MKATTKAEHVCESLERFHKCNEASLDQSDCSRPRSADRSVYTSVTQVACLRASGQGRWTSLLLLENVSPLS